MFTIRQIIDDPQEVIPIPVELHHRRIEVIFMALDAEPEPRNREDAIQRLEALRGKMIVGDVLAPVDEEWTDGTQPTLATLAEIGQRFPANPELPEDLAAQHDHYLYGLPKQP